MVHREKTKAIYLSRDSLATHEGSTLWRILVSHPAGTSNLPTYACTHPRGLASLQLGASCEACLCCLLSVVVVRDSVNDLWVYIQ